MYVTTSSNYKVQIMRTADPTSWSSHTGATPVIANTISGFSLHGNEITELNTYPFASEEGIQAGGNIKANAFIGDGSALTGIASGGSAYTEAVTAPSSPTNGDMWYDLDDDTLYQRQDGAWVQVSTTAAPAVLIYDVNGTIVN